MANPEHVEVVKRRAEAIEAWREANPVERLELKAAEQWKGQEACQRAFARLRIMRTKPKEGLDGS